MTCQTERALHAPAYFTYSHAKAGSSCIFVYVKRVRFLSQSKAKWVRPNSHCILHCVEPSNWNWRLYGILVNCVGAGIGLQSNTSGSQSETARLGLECNPKVRLNLRRQKSPLQLSQTTDARIIMLKRTFNTFKFCGFVSFLGLLSFGWKLQLVLWFKKINCKTLKKLSFLFIYFSFYNLTAKTLTVGYKAKDVYWGIGLKGMFSIYTSTQEADTQENLGDLCLCGKTDCC